MTNPIHSRLSRRHVLGGIGSVIALGAIPSPVSATGDPDDFIGVGENEIDANGDGDTDVKVYVAKDPAEGSVGRSDVTLITSDGVSTGDYATSVTSIGNIRFDSITNEQPKYDYYAGGSNENAAPDEVWLLVERDGNEHVLFDTINDGAPSAQAWKTAGIFSDTSHPDWNELNDDGSIGSYTAVDSDVIKRIGVGRGNFGGDIVSEVYYDNLRVDGKKKGEFPANGRAK